MAIYGNKGIHFNVDKVDSGGGKSSLSAMPWHSNECTDSNVTWHPNFLYVPGQKILSRGFSGMIGPIAEGDDVICWQCNPQHPTGCDGADWLANPWATYSTEIAQQVPYNSLTWQDAGGCLNCNLSSNHCCVSSSVSASSIFATGACCHWVAYYPLSGGIGTEPPAGTAPPLPSPSTSLHCHVVTSAQCANIAGTWQGYGTDCTGSSPCPHVGLTAGPSTGICCYVVSSGSVSDCHCTQLTSSECANITSPHRAISWKPLTAAGCAYDPCSTDCSNFWNVASLPSSSCFQLCPPCPTGEAGQALGGPTYLDCAAHASASSASCCPYKPDCNSTTNRFFRLVGWGCDATCYGHTMVKDALTVTMRAPNQIEINYQNLFWPPNPLSYGTECAGGAILIDGTPWWFHNSQLFTLNDDMTCAAWSGPDAVNNYTHTIVQFAMGPWSAHICEASGSGSPTPPVNPSTDVCIREVKATRNCTTKVDSVIILGQSCHDYLNLPAPSTFGVPQYNWFYEDTDCGKKDLNGDTILRFKAAIIDAVCTNGVCGPIQNPIDQLFNNFITNRYSGSCDCPSGTTTPSFGACCHDYSGSSHCHEVTSSVCAQITGGVWKGIGTLCSPNPCGPNPPIGACCSSGVCKEVSQADCLAGTGWDWRGAGIDCTPNPCSITPTTSSCSCPGQCVGTVQIHGSTSPWCDADYRLTPAQPPLVYDPVTRTWKAEKLYIQYKVTVPAIDTSVPGCCYWEGARLDFSKDGGQSWHARFILPPNTVGLPLGWGAQGGNLEYIIQSGRIFPPPMIECGKDNQMVRVLIDDKWCPTATWAIGPPLAIPNFPCPICSSSPLPPSASVGACCISSICLTGTQAACQAVGGAYLGNGKLCIPDPCSGSPLVNTSSSGACCSSYNCTTGTQAHCITIGGTYQGHGTNCTPDPCSSTSPSAGPPSPSLGACCIGDNCLTGTQVACSIAGGTYRGDGTNCTPNPCSSSSSLSCCAGPCWKLGHPYGTGAEVKICVSSSSSASADAAKEYYYFDEYYCEDLKTDTYDWICDPSTPNKEKRKRTVRIEKAKTPAGHVCMNDPNGKFYFVIPPGGNL